MFEPDRWQNSSRQSALSRQATPYTSRGKGGRLYHRQAWLTASMRTVEGNKSCNINQLAKASKLGFQLFEHLEHRDKVYWIAGNIPINNLAKKKISALSLALPASLPFTGKGLETSAPTGAQFENAAIPVCARPRISAWISCVPS